MNASEKKPGAPSLGRISILSAKPKIAQQPAELNRLPRAVLRGESANAASGRFQILDARKPRRTHSRFV